MRSVRLLLAAVVALALPACSGDDDAAPAPGSVGTAVETLPAPPTGSGLPTSSLLAPATSPVETPAPTTAAPATSVVPVAIGYPAQPPDVPFPAADWPVGPLPTGVDQATIDSAVDVAMGAADAPSGVRSVVVVQGGEIVYERYHPSVGPDTVMSSYSVAKSFTSAVIGLLVTDGLLTLDEHPPRPEWPDGDPRTAITLHELLQMSSGLHWDEVQDLLTMGPAMLASPSAAAIMASQPLERAPGSAFEYSTGTSALVAGIAADALGGCDALDTYVHERLLDPIGITTESIIGDGGGCFVGGFGMDMTTRDFARFGLLYARGGIWDGRQILPSSWVDETRVPAATNPQYGLHWWLGPTGGEVAAIGLGGQQIAVFPASDLVIAVNSTLGTDGPASTLVGQIAAAFGAVS